MNMTFTLDKDELTKIMGEFATSTNFAIQQTINNTLRDAQRAMINKIASEFQIRRPQFMKMSVKISQFAKKDNLTGIMGIMDVGGKSTADIFTKFEEDTNKRSMSGKRIAIPSEFIQPDKTRVVTTSKRPTNLPEKFLVTTKKGVDLLMVRTGRGKGTDVQVAYILKDSVPITSHRLTFYDTVNAIISQRLQINWNTAVERITATAHR